MFFLFTTAALILIATIVLFIRIRNSLEAGTLPYQRARRFFSPAEGKLYVALVQALEKKAVVLAKVQATEVLTPRTTLPRPEWQRAHNALSSRHFDFLICDPHDAMAKLAILLEHEDEQPKPAGEDVLRQACHSAGLPIITQPLAVEYDRAELRCRIMEILSPDQTCHEMHPEPAPVAEEQAQPPATPQPEKNEPSPPCPRCASPMIVRTVQSGENAGEKFWGCSRFPTCSGRIRIKQ